jgi:hypothetical protein
MARTKDVTFSELRQVLQGLGYRLKQTDKASIFHHPKEGLVVFRVYRDEEPVAELDLLSTRRFLDLRGLIDGKDFDSLLRRTATEA